MIYILPIKALECFRFNSNILSVLNIISRHTPLLPPTHRPLRFPTWEPSHPAKEILTLEHALVDRQTDNDHQISGQLLSNTHLLYNGGCRSRPTRSIEWATNPGDLIIHSFNGAHLPPPPFHPPSPHWRRGQSYITLSFVFPPLKSEPVGNHTPINQGRMCHYIHAVHTAFRCRVYFCASGSRMYKWGLL